MIARTLLGGAALLLCLAGTARAGAVLDHVRAVGTLSCGVLDEPNDYGKDDIHGALDALGMDLCRAVAAAVTGDAGRLRVTALHDEAHGFAALQAGKIDLLLGATPSAASALRDGLAFTAPVFLDGVGLLASRAAGLHSFAELAGKQVCFIAGTAAETALNAAAAARHVAVLPFPFEEDGEMQAALVTGHCAAVAASVSRLAVGRAGFHGQVSHFVVLPDRLSLAAMAPAMRGGDGDWTVAVGAVADALLLAEHDGVTAKLAADPNRQLPRSLAGALPAAGLDGGWQRRTIAAVGNYGELYDRDCGVGSPLGLERGANALWDRGGMLYPSLLR